MAPVRRTLHSATRSRISRTITSAALGALLALIGAPAIAAETTSLQVPLAFDRSLLTFAPGPDGASVSMAGTVQTQVTGQPRLPMKSLNLVLPRAPAWRRSTYAMPSGSRVGDASSLAKAAPLVSTDGGTVEVHGLEPQAGVFPPEAARAGGRAPCEATGWGRGRVSGARERARRA